ncbi:MAG: ParB N-terminal domain-containing protein [Rhodospirillales bacterium]
MLARRIDGAGEDYEIIAGERRWRAAQLAQLHEIPVLVRDFDDREAQEVAPAREPAARSRRWRRPRATAG